jgi:hypothetical protein
MIRLLTTFLFALSLAQAQPPGNDPIFGMNYDAGRVHFERATTLRPRCPVLWDQIPKAEVFYIFATAIAEGKEYIIVSSKTTEVSGAGLVMQENKCTVMNPDDMLENLPEAVIKALSSNALRRYSQAFGGKKIFLEALKKGGLKPDEMPKVLRDELAAFSREP